MKLFLFLLIIASFLQSSFLPMNLVLILIICRSYVVDETSNYLNAFIAGTFLGFLTTQNIGFWALILTIVVKIIHLSRKLPVSSNNFTIIPVAFVMILIVSLVEKLVFNLPFNFLKILLESLLCLPTFILIRFWEERFVIRPEIKLKIRA